MCSAQGINWTVRDLLSIHTPSHIFVDSEEGMWSILDFFAILNNLTL